MRINFNPQMLNFKGTLIIKDNEDDINTYNTDKINRISRTKNKISIISDAGKKVSWKNSLETFHSNIVNGYIFAKRDPNNISIVREEGKNIYFDKSGESVEFSQII